MFIRREHIAACRQVIGGKIRERRVVRESDLQDGRGSLQRWKAARRAAELETTEIISCSVIEPENAVTGTSIDGPTTCKNKLSARRCADVAGEITVFHSKGGRPNVVGVVGCR